MKPSEDIYPKAREILRGEPTMGKKRLAVKLGVKTPTLRRLMERFRGETQGHNNDPVYQRVRKLKEAQPDWGAGRISQELNISEDHAKLHLARWIGAQGFQSKGGNHWGRANGFGCTGGAECRQHLARRGGADHA